MNTLLPHEQRLVDYFRKVFSPFTAQDVDAVTFYEKSANVGEIAAALHQEIEAVAYQLVTAYLKLTFLNTAELRKPFYAVGYPFNRERVPKGGYRH